MESSELKDISAHMDKSVEAIRNEFATVRTGKASPALLDLIKVDDNKYRIEVAVAGFKQGEIDITFIRLTKTDAQIRARGVFVRDEIEKLLRARGFKSTNKIYAVFYDGERVLGGGVITNSARQVAS